MKDFYIAHAIAGPFTIDEVKRELAKSGDGVSLIHGRLIQFTVETQPRVVIGDEAAPAPKTARAYKPRKVTADAVLSVLDSEKGTTAEEVAKFANVSKRDVPKVLAWLAGESKAVESGGLWRRMVGV
jgi:hypothetical protein